MLLRLLTNKIMPMFINNVGNAKEGVDSNKTHFCGFYNKNLLNKISVHCVIKNSDQFTFDENLQN